MPKICRFIVMIVAETGSVSDMRLESEGTARRYDAATQRKKRGKRKKRVKYPGLCATTAAVRRCRFTESRGRDVTSAVRM